MQIDKLFSFSSSWWKLQLMVIGGSGIIEKKLEVFKVERNYLQGHGEK